jgi:hypothetical protein
VGAITQPDPASLIENLGLEVPPVGLYDAPDAAPFEPLVRPARGGRACIFSFFGRWRNGETLLLTADAFGCRGAGSCLLGLETRANDDLVTFLIEGEGLKRSRETMTSWVERREVYRPRHANILVGPLRWEQYEHLRSVTFFVDPDQLSALVVGAHYDCGPDDPPPVAAPFGSGCLQLLPPAGDPQVARAVIGATDPAMRPFLPPETLAFTVNRTMFGRLCALDDRSFLHKPFWRNLCRARGRE